MKLLCVMVCGFNGFFLILYFESVWGSEYSLCSLFLLYKRWGVILLNLLGFGRKDRS